MFFSAAVGTAGTLELDFKSGSAHFTGPGVSISAAKPGAVVTIDKIHVPLLLSGNGKLVSQTNVQTFLGPAMERQYRWQTQRNMDILWTVTTLSNGAALTFKTSIFNGTGQPARIQELSVLETEPEALRYSGSKSNWFLSTLSGNRQSGNLAQAPLANYAPLNSLATLGTFATGSNTDARVFSDFMFFYPDNAIEGLAMGAVGKPEASVRFVFINGPKRAALSIASEMSEVLLEPGSWRESQEVAILAQPYGQAASELAHWIASTHGSRAPDKSLVIWNGTESQEGLTSRQWAPASAAMSSTMSNTRQVLRFDLSELAIPSNAPAQAATDFATAIMRTAQAQSLAGVSIAPLKISASNGVADEHPEWFQKRADGTLITRTSPNNAPYNLLDPTQPEAARFLINSLSALKTSGLNYLEVDLSQLDREAYLADSTKTRLQAARSTWEACSAALGDGVCLVASFGPARAAAGFANVWKCGTDYRGTWSGSTEGGVHEALIAAGPAAVLNGVLFAVTPGIVWPKPNERLFLDPWRTWHSFAGLMGGPVLVASSPDRLDAESGRNLEILAPPAQAKGWSFDGATDRENRRMGFLVRQTASSFVSMMVWNPAEASADVPVGGSEVAALGKRFHVWSFWDEKYLGVMDQSLVMKGIAPHSCKVLRLTAVSPRTPVLVGSTLHISMGAAEVSEFQTGPHSISIRLTQAGAQQGRLIVASSKKIEFRAADGCVVDSVRESATGIWEIAVSERDRSQEQQIELNLL